jgi:hypothetical protein
MGNFAQAMELVGMMELASVMQVTKVKFVLRSNALKTATTMVCVLISLVNVTRDIGVSLVGLRNVHLSVKSMALATMALASANLVGRGSLVKQWFVLMTARTMGFVVNLNAVATTLGWEPTAR